MRVIVLVGLALALGTSDAAAPTEPLRVNVKLVVRITPIDGPTRGVGFTGRVIGRGEHQTTGSVPTTRCARAACRRSTPRLRAPRARRLCDRLAA